MNRDDFDAEFERACDAIEQDQLSERQYEAVLARLSGMREQLERDFDRRVAAADIAEVRFHWRTRHDPDYRTPESVERATQAMWAGWRKQGTIPERIARARAALEEMGRIAEAAPHAEQMSIMRTTEGLVLLIEKLEADQRQSSP